ncbi:MAG: hypothetical protein ACRC33_28215 [Gemmataceae bacterium]
MTPGSGTSVYALTAYPVHGLPTPAHRYLLRAWWACDNGAGGSYRRASDLVISTGDTLSVIPPQIRFDMDLLVTAEAGWAGTRLGWRGILCRVGRARLTLHDDSGHPRDFSPLVLLPNRMPPDLPPFIHLGAQFLDEFAARLEITPAAGRLLVP